MTWPNYAACLEADPELFFPIGESGPALRQIAEAKQICGGCPVRQQCLQWALDTDQNAGVWGGLSESERFTLKRRLGRGASIPAA
jgi:WhiB family transcriptional regulator, redox-sensing transcriptional regulator